MIEAYEKIEVQIKKIREEEAKLADLFANMRLAQPKIDIHMMEWTGKAEICEMKEEASKTNKSNPEKDERDIVNILLTTNQNSKIIVDER